MQHLFNYDLRDIIAIIIYSTSSSIIAINLIDTTLFVHAIVGIILHNFNTEKLPREGCHPKKFNRGIRGNLLNLYRSYLNDEYQLYSLVLNPSRKQRFVESHGVPVLNDIINTFQLYTMFSMLTIRAFI